MDTATHLDLQPFQRRVFRQLTGVRERFEVQEMPCRLAFRRNAKQQIETPVRPQRRELIEIHLEVDAGPIAEVEAQVGGVLSRVAPQLLLHGSVPQRLHLRLGLAPGIDRKLGKQQQGPPVGHVLPV